MRDKVYIATKTGAKTPEEFWEHLETSLKNLRTDYVDLYQFHCADQCYRPGDGTGMYECMEEAKRQGKIRHIGITAHKLYIAEEIVRPVFTKHFSILSAICPPKEKKSLWKTAGKRIWDLSP